MNRVAFMPSHLAANRKAAQPDTDELVNPTAHFLDEWIDTHIDEAIVVPPGADPAAQLARQCVRDAKTHGIDVEEIEGEVGDLEEYIAEALVEEHPDLETAPTPEPLKPQS